VTNLAREAIGGLEGIDSLRLIGARATFTLEKGRRIDENTVSAALEAKGLGFESMTTEMRPPVAAAYRARVTGIT
jgi:hypothetical protein